MGNKITLEVEKRKLENEISELKLEISKAENTPDKDGRLSWTRDDEIAQLYKELEQKTTRLKELNRLLERCNN